MFLSLLKILTVAGIGILIVFDQLLAWNIDCMDITKHKTFMILIEVPEAL